MFYVLLKGKGTGCDYTIACNRKWHRLMAESWKEAEVEVATVITSKIESATILEVVGKQTFDIQGFFKRKEAAALEKKRLEKLAVDKKQYERLKAIFEPEEKPSTDNKNE